MASKFAKRLAGMQKKFDAAQAPASPGECTLDPGKYRVKVTGTLKEINGKLNIEWTYTVIEGDSEGEVVTSLDGLENENSLPYLKKRIKQFGYDSEDFDLAEQLESLLEQISESEPVGVIQVKQNGDYTNVYLNKVELDDEGSDAEDGEEVEAEDGDENDSEEVEAEEEAETEAEEEAEAEAEEEEEAVTIEKGMTVLYQPPKTKKASEFVVVSVNEKAGTVKLKGYPTAVKLDQLQLPEPAEEEAEEVEEEADEAEMELEPGMTVAVNIKGKNQKGVVQSINEEEETVRVKIDNKIYKVAVEQITGLKG